LTYVKLGRAAEREADFLSLQYMYKAGYDPNAYITFFERIQANEKRRLSTIPYPFSTQPAPGPIGNTQKEIAQNLIFLNLKPVPTWEMVGVMSLLGTYGSIGEKVGKEGLMRTSERSTAKHDRTNGAHGLIVFDKDVMASRILLDGHFRNYGDAHSRDYHA